MGWALSPTAQSGRAGKGCFDEVDVYVCREDDEVEDYKYQVRAIERHKTPMDATVSTRQCKEVPAGEWTRHSE